MKTQLILVIILAISSSIFAQSDVSQNIVDFIPLMKKEPTSKQVEKLKSSLKSSDTLEYTLATSILFKYFPVQYKDHMMDAFEIPYQDSRRATVNYFYKEDEVSKINEEIAKNFGEKYEINKSKKNNVYLLYTFLEYRKRNVWTYKNEQIAIPTTIAFRGGYLRGLLNDTMDYKKFIGEMIERTKLEYQDKNKG